MFRFLYHLLLVVLLLHEFNRYEFQIFVAPLEAVIALFAGILICFLIPYFKRNKLFRTYKKWQPDMAFPLQGRILSVTRIKNGINIIVPVFLMLVVFVTTPYSGGIDAKVLLLVLLILQLLSKKDQDYFGLGSDFMVIFANYNVILPYNNIKELDFKEAHLMINTVEGKYYVLDLKAYTPEQTKDLFVYLRNKADENQIKISQNILNI